MSNPVTTAYVISKQGNRNLVLDNDDLQFFDDLTRADTQAHREARESGRAWFVLELTVRAVRSHRPSTVVESRDIV